eukprot:TRINITY_DN6030_c1_g1_i1.p1 TRINITY_DN6030_c1_g1~~TRINITY_DN6030_c1_g1_i1.p1  ORF type:complete len:275 (+),score=62.35 TRINITY_DN6030_c1_g1_i1:3-827(+)
MEMVTAGGEVRKIVLKEGDGPAVTPHSIAHVRYKLFVTAKGAPRLVEQRDTEWLAVRAGRRHVIEGVDRALLSMRSGDRVTLIVLPSLAYGAIGCPPAVPPNASILCHLEVGRVEPVHDEISRCVSLTDEEFLEHVESIRQEGNESFRAQALEDAVQSYRSALNLLKSRFDNEDMPSAAQSQRGVLLANLAACHGKLEDYHAVVDCCIQGLRMDNSSAKLHYRLGCAYISLGDLDNALRSLATAHKLVPADKNVKKALDRIRAMREKKQRSYFG